jgi:hypothetical protein
VDARRWPLLRRLILKRPALRSIVTDQENIWRTERMTDKEKLKEILKWCKINAKGWDPDQHDGPAEFKAICDLIEEKGYYKKK